VSEVRLLRNVSEAKWDQITGDLRTLRDEELHGVYCSQNVIQMIESKIMSWACYVARTRVGSGSCRIVVEGNVRKRVHFEELDVNGRMT
jgi:hypothetical protein